ncbi:hypothetical protein ACLF3G_23790 [Falsiroseomonas sp. HC035]|uniref:hypothetical protein n=1 Tax=Falsiroseomonas sp. HC035 TaxID=3390999 RepID=UPI003D31DD68
MIEYLIAPRARDRGGFEVRRTLPVPQRQMVGPFIFLDQATGSPWRPADDRDEHIPLAG